MVVLITFAVTKQLNKKHENRYSIRRYYHRR